MRLLRASARLSDRVTIAQARQQLRPLRDLQARDGACGAAGCALARGMLRVVVALPPQGMLRLEQAAIDRRVPAFALATSRTGGLPAGLHASRISKGRGAARRLLVAAQVAASAVLLFAAGFCRAGCGVLNPYRPDQAAFLNDLAERLARLPGVERLAVADTLPPVDDRRTRIYAAIDVRGREQSREGTGGMATWRVASPGCFETPGIPIVEGRGFTVSGTQPAG